MGAEELRKRYGSRAFGTRIGHVSLPLA